MSPYRIHLTHCSQVRSRDDSNDAYTHPHDISHWDDLLDWRIHPTICIRQWGYRAHQAVFWWTRKRIYQWSSCYLHEGTRCAHLEGKRWKVQNIQDSLTNILFLVDYETSWKQEFSINYVWIVRFLGFRLYFELKIISAWEQHMKCNFYRLFSYPWK